MSQVIGNYEVVRRFPGGFQKYNRLTGRRVTVWIEGTGNDRKVHIRQEQEVQSIIELNKYQQNNFAGYRNQLMVQQTRIPEVVHYDIMRKCGWKPGTGGQYDKKRFKQIINDIDFKYLRTVPGRI